MKKRFLSVLLCLCMVLGLVPVTVWAATTSGHTHYLCGGDTCSGSGHEAESSKTTFATEIVQTGSTLKIGGKSWAATTGSNGNTFYILPAGTYYLGSDISPKYTIRIEKNVTLCLNGYKITATNGMDAIELASGSFTLTDCKTTGKITHASSKTGRGVYVKGGTFNMYGGSITGNTAQDFNGRGGGVYVTSGGGTFKMFGGSITGNKASYGGGVYMIGSNSKFTMTGGSITGNKATYGGGGVYVNSGDFTMTGGTIGGTKTDEANKATYGGGVYVLGSANAVGTFNMTGGSITGNNTSYGGGVYVSGGTFTMSASDNGQNIPSITGNTATSDGGGVYVFDGSGTFTMSGGTIGGTKTDEANKATNGGGVYVGSRGEFAMSGNASISGNGAKWGGGVCVGNGTFTMTDGSITGNNATINGGGVYLASTGRFTMSNGSITSNNAGGDGGGVYVDGGTFHMSSGSITGNKTDGNGGGVYVYCGSFEMSADGQNIPSVSGNTAKNYGGGVYVYGGTFTMKSGSITGNTANNDGGGGVYVNGGSFTMESGSITGNKTIASGTGGGGVYVTGDKSTFTMNSGSITGNTAKNYGGGVGVGKSGTFNMTGGGITGNTATISGGGVYVTWDNGTFKMTGGSITGNNAEYGGGVRVNGTFTVSGSVNVTGNTRDGTQGTDGKFTDGTNNNVYLPEGKTITVGTGGLITGASIGVTTATKPAKDSPVQIATNATESADYTEIFTPDAGTMYTITKSGTSVYLALHVHTWTYALKEGTTDTITATCKNCEDNNGQDFVGGSVILKVSQDLTYDGTKKTASKWADEVSTDSPAFSDITYYEKSDNAWTQLSSAPINVGEYKAVLTATNADSSTATAFVTYSIEKANKEAPNGLTTEEDRYNTGKGKLIGTTADMEYNTSADTATGWKDCSDGSTEVAPGTYYVRYKETDNYYASAVSAALTVKAHTHSGGNATCKNKAVCDGCGQEYGELGNHNFTETVDGRYLVSAATCDSKAVYNKSCSVCGAKSDETFESGEFDYTNHIGSTYKKNQKEATCYDEGYTGDIYCNTCDQIIEKGTPIAKNDHNPASVWTTDKTDHWKECQTVGCGNIIDKAHHSGGEATCVKKAICSVCKVEYGDVDATNHKHTEVRDAKEATCCEKGYTGDTWCIDCNTKVENGNEISATGNHVDVDGKWENDGTNHWHTCYFGTKFDVTAHSGGEATCISKANCSVCEIEYGNVDASNHKHTEVRDVKEATCCEKGYTGDTWCIDCNKIIENGSEIAATGNHTDVDGKWESDETNHWHTCYFGTKFDITAHNGGEATCKKQAECSECGHSYGSFDASNHKGTTYLKDQKEATCYDEGYTGDTYCSDCNEKIADGQSIAKNAHNPASVWTTDEHDHWKECQTVGCGNVIDKAAHSGGEATCVSKAVCEVCKAQYGDVDATNHKHTEIRNAKPATEQEKGYTGDTWCTDCNKKIADGKETDLLSHSLKKVEAKAATTRENGNIEYFYCAGCGKYFADQDATKEITLAQTVLEKLKGNEESPKTGDDNMVAVWSLAAILSLAVLGFTTVVSKKKRAK